MGHSMLYYENTIILYGGVSDNHKFEDNKFYQYKLDYKMWSILNITGVNPGFRAFHSMSFFNSHTIFIFGGKSTQEKLAEDYTVNNEFFFVDMIEKNSMNSFIAGIAPSVRFGHKTDGNNKSGSEELVLIGGLDKVYCPMDIYLLKEKEINQENIWVYEQKKHSTEQLNEEKDHIFETAKNTILLYKKQLEILELRNLEINKK